MSLSSSSRIATNPLRTTASHFWATLTATYARRAGLLALIILVLVGLALLALVPGSAAPSLSAFDTCIGRTLTLSVSGTPIIGGQVVQPAAEQVVDRSRGGGCPVKCVGGFPGSLG